MYYYPMIAKLCSWAPTRAGAIEVMRNALDSFEVEGIGHNLPFCAAVMDHPRFISGDISTAFIEEEYPDGFKGVTPDTGVLRRLAAAAAHMKTVRETRDALISGAMRNHARTVAPDWVVTIAKTDFALHVTGIEGGSQVSIDGDGAMTVLTDWTPGDSLANVTVDGAPMALKVDAAGAGFRLRYRGADLRAYVRSPRAAELAVHMIEKLPPDTSKLLLCPMPGLVVNIAVEVGQEVQEGEALCTVEAMKMENVLRAEKRARVTKLNAKPGDSLAVDEVIMEFEPIA
jgi:propionyl-CoA carboxylase alpha chain